MTALTSEAVRTIASECLYARDEPHDDAIIVEGIVTHMGFHPERIAKNTDKISELLAELPTEFHAKGGGGWTFLNACNDKHGIQWTGLHREMELLFCLGIAAGKAKWMLPRDMWEVMPGGMPYVVVL